MNTDIAIISRKNYSEEIKLLEKKLTDLRLSKHEIMIAELLVEETFLYFENATANPENFSASISLKKRTNNVNIIVSVKDEVFNPLKNLNLSQFSPEDSEYWNSNILKVYINKLNYSRKNGENIITIKVHETKNKTVRNTFIGLIVGLILGFLLKTFVNPEVNSWLIENIIDSLQRMFINALMMAVAPMIFFAVIDGIVGISDAAYIGRIGKKLMIFSLLKLVFYVTLGLGFGYFIGGMPEILSLLNDDVAPYQGSNVSIRDLIVNIIPSNTVSPFNENNVLQLLFLACFLGIMLNRSGEYASWAKNGIKFMSRFTIDVVGVLSLVIPFLVTVSIIELIIEIGIQGMYPYIKIVLASACCLFLSFIISSFLIFVTGKILPCSFFKKIMKFSVLPFSLSSSNACLPATLSFCTKKLGMDEKIIQFSIPVGMQFNMDGTAFYVSVISMILVRTFEIEINAAFLFSFFLIEFFMALTGIGLIIMPPILSTLGIPEAAVAHFIGIEPILDMFGTAQSVTGNITSSFVVNRWENKLDEKIYYSPE